jgi:two-component system, OmpR family, response regulator
MSRTVLVVDDEPDIVLGARLMLEAAGHSVIEAGGGEEALELVQRMRVDAAFVDLLMPGVDGWGVLEELHAKGMSRLPVIVLTAHCDLSTLEQSAARGAAGYVSKPFLAADLTRTLEAVFEPASDPNRMTEGSAGTL